MIQDCLADRSAEKGGRGNKCRAASLLHRLQRRRLTPKLRRKRCLLPAEVAQLQEMRSLAAQQSCVKDGAEKHRRREFARKEEHEQHIQD